jgi:hypothetical protein
VRTLIAFGAYVSWFWWENAATGVSGAQKNTMKNIREIHDRNLLGFQRLVGKIIQLPKTG